MALSKKHRAFVEEYLTCFNATEAYSRVYSPKTRAAAASNGHLLLRRPSVQAALERCASELSGERAIEIQRHISEMGHQRVSAKPSTLYLIREEHGAYKIGVAANLKARFATLSTMIPYSLEVVMSFLVEDALRDERSLHLRFKSKRIKGEWFQLSDKDVEWIKRKYGYISKAASIH